MQILFKIILGSFTSSSIPAIANRFYFADQLRSTSIRPEICSEKDSEAASGFNKKVCGAHLVMAVVGKGGRVTMHLMF